MAEVHSTAVTLQWTRPPGSGVDTYRLAFRPFGADAAPTTLNGIVPVQATIDTGLFPGRTYEFALQSLKGQDASDTVRVNVTLSKTISLQDT